MSTLKTYVACVLTKKPLGTLSGDRIYYTGGWVRSTSDKVTVQMDLLSIDISNSWKWDEVELAEEGSNGGPSGLFIPKMLYVGTMLIPDNRGRPCSDSPVFERRVI